MRVETKAKLKLKLQERREEANKEFSCDFVDVATNLETSNNQNASTLQVPEITNKDLDPLSSEVQSAELDNAIDCNTAIDEKQSAESEAMNLVESLLEVTMEVGEKSDHSQFLCNQCNAKFDLYSDLRAHQLLHHVVKRKRRKRSEMPVNLDPSILPNQCSVCKKILSKKSALSIHMRIHTGDSPYECKICNKKCKTQGNINIHMRIHTGERPYECNICHWRCQTVSHLKKHKVKHLSERRYQCEICKRRFKIIAHLQRHMLVHTDNRPHACALCSKKYTQRNHLNKHMAEKHPSHLE